MPGNIKFTDTTLRDGQQSLIATRMRVEDMEPILDDMDEAGFHSVEVWGGATFDAAMRFLREDPWERLRTFKKHFKKTKLQMLFRGQNIVGYHCYPDDVVEAFIRKAAENGIDIFRVFDALNDTRNIETSLRAIKKENAHAQLAICYTISEIHTTEYFIGLAERLMDMGADSICIKDMAGLLLPGAAYELVKGIKERVKLPLQIHSHYTSGLASMSYIKAVEAGADIIDTAAAPFAMGTSQPATEIMLEALENLGYSIELNKEKIRKISAYFKPLREAAYDSGLLNAKALSMDIGALEHQIPGGMLSNLVSQLKQANAENKYDAALKEIPIVRKELGLPPLVTPASQIVGTQAVFNVISGERYKITPSETKDLVRGKYGHTPAPISREIKKALIGDEEPATERPGASLAPAMDRIRKEIAEYMESEEDAISYALFPNIAVEFFKFRQAQKYKADPNFADKKNKVYPI